MLQHLSFPTSSWSWPSGRLHKDGPARWELPVGKTLPGTTCTPWIATMLRSAFSTTVADKDVDSTYVGSYLDLHRQCSRALVRVTVVRNSRTAALRACWQMLLVVFTRGDSWWRFGHGGVSRRA
jgi:hypothetical protein